MGEMQDALIPTKQCPKCDEPMIQRPQRYRKDGTKNGRGWTCNPCANVRMKEYKAANPREFLDSRLWTYYRIRLTDYEKLLAYQDHRCAACRRHVSEVPNYHRDKVTGYSTGLTIDHDHNCCPSLRTTGGGGGSVCGKCIRGLLCYPCNSAIGYLNDNPERCRQLASYLRSANSLTLRSK